MALETEGSRGAQGGEGETGRQADTVRTSSFVGLPSAGGQAGDRKRLWLGLAPAQLVLGPSVHTLRCLPATTLQSPANRWLGMSHTSVPIIPRARPVWVRLSLCFCDGQAIGSGRTEGPFT